MRTFLFVFLFACSSQAQMLQVLSAPAAAGYADSNAMTATGWHSDGGSVSPYPRTQRVELGPGDTFTDAGIILRTGSQTVRMDCDSSTSRVNISGGVSSTVSGFVTASTSTTAFYATGATNSAASFYSDATTIGASMGSASGTCAYKLRTAGARWCGSGAGTWRNDDGTTTTENGPMLFSSTTNKGSCTLNGGTPATCTATITAGAKCTCSNVGTTAAIAALGCAVDIVATTLTITSAAGATHVVNYLCL